MSMWEARIGYTSSRCSRHGDVEPYLWPATNTVLRNYENSDKEIGVNPSSVVHGSVPGVCVTSQ